MKAMIFAAGLGTRLKPATDHCPKALVTVAGKTLLEHLILKLIELNIRDIIINVHHFSDQVLTFLQQKRFFDINIAISDESGLLLDTGGGLKNAAWFFDDGESFVAHNVDVITDLDVGQLAGFHKSTGALATLAVRNRQTARYLLFSNEGDLTGWENMKTGEKIMVHQSAIINRYAFSGVQMINPMIFRLLPEKEKFSVIEAYLEISRDQKINAFEHNQSVWFDVGNPEILTIAENFLIAKEQAPE